jgi:hypothetical protein
MLAIIYKLFLDQRASYSCGNTLKPLHMHTCTQTFIERGGYGVRVDNITILGNNSHSKIFGHECTLAQAKETQV